MFISTETKYFIEFYSSRETKFFKKLGFFKPKKCLAKVLSIPKLLFRVNKCELTRIFAFNCVDGKYIVFQPI